MTRRVALVWLGGLAASVSACGGSPSASTPAPPAATVAVPAPAPPRPVVPAASIPSTPAGAETARLVPPAPQLPARETPDCDARVRRDPFAVLDIASGPAGLTIASTKLTGIIHSGRSAIALVETSDGIGYILKPGDTLGDGRLVEVSADSAVFAVAANPGAPVNRVVLRLAAN